MATAQTTTKGKTTKKSAPPAVTAAPSKAVAVKGQNSPVTINPADWGAPTITSKDIVIPKIFAMQAMSKLVVDGKAKFGEFIDSLSGLVLGDTKNPIEFIPFYMEKVFVVMEEKNKKFEFKTQIPIAADNENEEFEQESPEGVAQKWYRTLNFYCLFPKEIANGSAIPYLISFRSASARAGQALATVMFMKNLKAGKTPASVTMALTGEKKTNDKGTFIVLGTKEVRPSTDAEVIECFEWVKTIKGGGVKVDHSDLVEEASAGSGPVNESEAEY